jgi:hypothetical protein
MKKRSVWRNLFFFGLWLAVGAVAIAMLMPSRQRATPQGATADSAPQTNADVPTLDLSSSSGNTPPPHFEVAESTASGGAAPMDAVRSTSDGPTLGAPTAAPEAAAPGPSYPDAEQYGAISPGAGAPEFPATAAPEEPTATASEEAPLATASPNGSSVGEGDAIEEPSEPERSAQPEGLGLSGIGEGGGGSGEGIGLGNIGTLKSGGGSGIGSGFGSGRGAAHPPTRSIAIDETAKPPMPPDASVSSTDEAMSEVDRKLDALPLGNIAFNTPESIPLGETAEIELLVSMKEAEEALRQAVHGPGPVETSSALLAPQMEAKVTGLGFHIEAITPERQAVSHTQETRWRWQIEPIKSDTLELNLTLSAIIKVEGEPTARTIRTFEKTIVVKVPFTKRLTTAMSNNIELLTTVVLLPVAGGTWRFVRRRKRRQSAAPDDEISSRKAA